jgi:hypothetical protein
LTIALSQLTLNKGAEMDENADIAKELEVLIRSILRQAYPEPRPAETSVAMAPHPPDIPTVPEVCKMRADKLTFDERKHLALLIERMLGSRQADADRANDLPAAGDHTMLLGKRATRAEMHRPESQRVDPLKIIGVVIAVLLLALAGHASLGMPGLVIGLLIGISIAISVVKLLCTPMNESRAFDPVPSNDMEHDHSRH